MTDLPTLEVQPGADFVGYRVDELIGRGGMGVVYRAYDLRLKRAVALKLVSPELARDERFRARFARETEAAMSLEHPNVVPVYDAGDVDGRLYLAMRLVAGTDLRRLLAAEGPLEPSRAAGICRQVAGALDAAHAKGLVHRDVKPSNVLLDENEHVYLADFGLTRRLEEQGSAPVDGRSVGTPAYLAPEQIEGDPVDARTDVYALGCLLFECLTGTPPYVRGSRLAVTWAHLEEQPPRASELRPELPEAVDSVIAKAMAKEPDGRYRSAGALAEAAGDALGLGRASRLGRPGLALLAAATAVALAATLAAVLASRGGHPAASPPLFAGPNTLARIDPATNKVSDVIHVGADPVATAARGRSVWVYNREDETISEIDVSSRKVRETTPVRVSAIGDDVFAGPSLVADRRGAWLVGLDRQGRGTLVRIRPGGATRFYRLGVQPRGVGVGLGAVWVIGRGARGYELLRFDPSTGRLALSRRFRAAIDSIGVGDGAVYLVSASRGLLYRLDPRSHERLLSAELGGRATRPLVTGDFIGLGTSEQGGTSVFLDPLLLGIEGESPDALPPAWGEGRWSRGWLWWSDWPTGSVYRQHGPSATPKQIHVTKPLPQAKGPCLNSIDIGAGAVWVTATGSNGLSCAP
jgi:hypothetical protein